MLKDAIEYLVGLVRNGESREMTQKIKLPLNGKEYDYNFKIEPQEFGPALTDVIRPLPVDVLTVTTLTSFVAAIDASVFGDSESEMIVHVEDPNTVAVKTAEVDQYGKRTTMLVAKHQPPNAFVFDQYYDDLSRLVIALQASFVPDESLQYLLKLVSNLKAGNSIQSNDDGFSQTITMKTGEVSTVDVNVKPRIWLKPIRTFTEIEPVASEFLLRFKQNNNGIPSVAIFNVDRQRWRNDTMQAIKGYLSDIVGGIPVLA